MKGRDAALAVGRAWITGTVVALACSCSSTNQVQYFAAVNPDTAAVSFYKMTLSGQSGWLDDYTLKAGYFNTITLDALDGNVKDPPEVRGDEAQLAAVKRIRDDLYASLETWSQPAEGRPATREEIIRAARAYWIATLDSMSLASVGSTESLDQYVFQKLVFWAESKTVDLSQLQAQFDNLIKNTHAVVTSLREREQEREKQEEEAEREKSLTKYFGALETAAGGDEEMRALVQALEAAALQLPAEDRAGGREAMVRGLLAALRVKSSTVEGSAIPTLVDALEKFLLPTGGGQ